jgi:hypothetical protein
VSARKELGIDRRTNCGKAPPSVDVTNAVKLPVESRVTGANEPPAAFDAVNSCMRNVTKAAGETATGMRSVASW